AACLRYLGIKLHFVGRTASTVVWSVSTSLRMEHRMRAFLVDDEELALKRLKRLLAATGRIEVAGTATDPQVAIPLILELRPEVLFLDIEMPGMNGFEMLTRLDPQPLVICTTAYDQYALRAFGVDSVDYLLKPIEAQQLDRALRKI